MGRVCSFTTLGSPWSNETTGFLVKTGWLMVNQSMQIVYLKLILSQPFSYSRSIENITKI